MPRIADIPHLERRPYGFFWRRRLPRPGGGACFRALSSSCRCAPTSRATRGSVRGA
mgnify:FL=1